MNHLKTGNAFFAQGSYKAYKFAGNELQETGFYGMNARFYMADLGRFGQYDPLSASTLDPYGYGYNNPIMFADSSGLEGEPVNGETGPGGPQSIGTATNPIDVGEVIVNAPIRAMASNTTSIMPSNCLVCNGGGISAPGLQNTPTPSVPIQTPSENWYGLAGQGNWFFGTAGVLSGFGGSVQSRNMYSQGIRRGISGNYRLTGRNLSQFGNAAMTDATIPISKIGSAAKIAGHFSFGVGVISDIAGTATGQVSLGKAVINTGFGVAGNWGGPIGASLSTVYFGVDGFYPGGWPGIFNDGNIMQAKLDEGFNQAGPYRINVFGAHEPK